MAENLPALTVHLLDLYKGPLRDIRFPDADEARLNDTIDLVTEARAALARAEMAVEAARALLEEKHRVLAHETERTLAYARVFAEQRPDLQAALDALPRPTRGRPRKARPLEAAAE